MATRTMGRHRSQLYPSIPQAARSLLALLGLLGGGQLLGKHLLHALLLLDEEGAHHAGAHAVGAAGATVGAVHAALTLLQAPVLHRAQGRHANDGLAAVTALRRLRLLLQLLEDELAARGLDLLLLVRLGVVADVLAVGQALDHCWIVGVRGHAVTPGLAEPMSLEPK